MRDDDEPAVPVTVVTGFLGAGKTTLVNRWLGEFARGEVAVVVNEFGEIGVDGALLAERARTVTELTGGCVCCTSHEELVRALADLAARRPRRILVETSGAASPSGVVRAIAKNPSRDLMRLDGIVTVVNGERLGVLDTSDLAREQVAYADVIVVSRCEERPSSWRDEVLAAMAERNGMATVRFASRGVLDDSNGAGLEAVLASRVLQLPDRPRFARTRAHEAFESVSLAIDGEVDEEHFGEWMESQLGALVGRVFRVKGIVAVRGLDEPMVVQGVADDVEVTFADGWGDRTRTTRMVVIGVGLDGEVLRATFAACAATD